MGSRAKEENPIRLSVFPYQRPKDGVDLFSRAKISWHNRQFLS